MVEQDVRRSLSLNVSGYVLQHGRVVLEGNGSELINDFPLCTAYLGTFLPTAKRFQPQMAAWVLRHCHFNMVSGIFPTNFTTVWWSSR